MNVALHPCETSTLVIEAEIMLFRAELGGGGKAKDVCAVVHCDDDDILVRCKARTVICCLASISELQGPTIDCFPQLAKNTYP